MKFVCDAPGGKSWFRIETSAEAAAESLAMRHAVEKFFLAEEDKAARKYRSTETEFFEQEIGLKAHLQRSMPMFMTLRDGEGRPLATAMLPANGRDSVTFRPIIVGAGNGDPYPEHHAAIEALGRRFLISLDRARCFPYARD
ncbi:MAG: hypothetical protein WDN69_14950 [Aliidongia sp.]